jgi:hypothetical protein
MAGTGKTAIASTFAKDMDSQGLLGASFFIDRQQGERRELHRIIQTLAFDLAVHDFGKLRALWAFLRANPTFKKLPWQDQLRYLIQKPLQVGYVKNFVIVIDGLDESASSEGASLLSSLMTCFHNHPIKIFVTSRNEQNIADELLNIKHIPMRLQDLEVSGDVRIFYEHSLDVLCRTRRLRDWRSNVSLELMVELTGPLFIYAVTLLKIIQNTRGNPIAKLQALLKIAHLDGGSNIAFERLHKHNVLEQLYFHILTEALRDHHGHISSDYAARLHDILEVVFFAMEPLTAQALSSLLNIERNELDNYLFTLASVLIVPDVAGEEGLIRPFHQSFRDFVLQQGDLIHEKLFMDSDLANAHLTQYCLRALGVIRQKNPAYIHSRHYEDEIALPLGVRPSEASFTLPSHHHSVSASQASEKATYHSFDQDSSIEKTLLDVRLNDEVSGVQVPLELSHSCMHWLRYLARSGTKAKTVFPQVEEFLSQNALYWIELATVLGSLSALYQTVLTVPAFLKVYQDPYSRKSTLTCAVT